MKTRTDPAAIPHLTFSGLVNLPLIRHAVFTRTGGVSLAPYDTLNVSHGTEDAHSHVNRNRELICESMGADRLVFVHQVHGDHILVVDETIPVNTDQVKADAMVTDVPGKFLALQVADCQPVLLADPVRNVVGAVHSGWRGSISDIVGKTATAMVREYGCRPENIRVGIGPSLGPCCAEFVNYRTEIPKRFWQFKNDINHFDFWAITRHQMLAKGVLEKHIEVAGICTKCHADRFFSFRRQSITGRFAAVVGIME